jgi:hypothetical protein
MGLGHTWISQQLKDAAQALVSHGMPTYIPQELDDDHPVIPPAADSDQDVATASLLSWSEQAPPRTPVLRPHLPPLPPPQPCAALAVRGNCPLYCAGWAASVGRPVPGQYHVCGEPG